MPDYSTMSAAELNERLHEITEQRHALREEALAVHAAMDKQILAEDAERRVAALSDSEKAALRQALGPEGVETEEAVGVPGAGE